MCVRCTSDLQAARIYKACGRDQRKFFHIGVKEVFVFLGESALDGNVGYALNFTELNSVAFEQISDFHKKEKIDVQELGESAWEKVNYELHRKGGVNPHAYLLGFEEGFRQAKELFNKQVV